MKRSQKAIVLLILLVIGIATTYLFYNQALRYDHSDMQTFESDLGAHIDAALKTDMKQYTITKPIYRFVYNNCGQAMGIAVLLSLVVIAMIVMTQKIMELYMKKTDKFLTWIYAVLLNFVIAIYIPSVHDMWNSGVQESVEWHNSTFICMKLLGIIALFIYFKLEKEYLKKINIPQYLLFCVTLILVNSVKPNFILAFAPAMLVFLIIDFFKNIKSFKAIRNIIIFGCAVLISLPILIYQNNVLFADDTGSGIAIEFMTALKMYHNHPLFSIAQSAAFPIFMLLTNLKRAFEERKYSFAVVINTVALSEFLFLCETGERATHGNFDYGYSFTLILAFISGAALLEERRTKENKNAMDIICLVIGYLLLAMHIACGIAYFVRLLQGKSYY